jgi:hypothetical protein
MTRMTSENVTRSLSQAGLGFTIVCHDGLVGGPGGARGARPAGPRARGPEQTLMKNDIRASERASSHGIVSKPALRVRTGANISDDPHQR